MSMRKKFPGSVVRANPVVPTEDSAPGIWTLEQQNQNQSRGTWPFAGDPNFKDTVLLLHGDTSQQPSIEDKSASNHEVTVTGDLRATNWNPFNLPEGYWSNYFDGDSNYLWISNIPIGTQPYTFECFVFITSGVQQYQGIFSAGATNASSIQFQLSNELMRLSSYTAQILVADAGDEVPLNTWTHLAFVRDSSNVLRFFKDGVLIKSGTDSTNWSETTADMLVGRIFNSSTHDFEGYISNLHFVVGTAKYTASFSKPTAPITPDANTKLLTCQSNGFNNKSANGGSLGSVGDAEVATFSPFSYTPTATVNNYGSYYFDGSGDYLTVPATTDHDFGTGDFTVEFWLFPEEALGFHIFLSAPQNTTTQIGYDTGNGPRYLYFYNGANIISGTGATSLVAFSWNHVALVREGTTISLFSNGNRVGTATHSSNVSFSNLNIGRYHAGGYDMISYMSNVRLIKGTAIYDVSSTTYTVPTKPTELTLVEGENSVYMDGSGDYLKAADNGELDLGTGDFTIEAWLYLSSAPHDYQMIVCSDGGNQYVTLRASSVAVRITSEHQISYTTTPIANEWFHLAVVRSGSTITAYIDGVSIGTATDSGDFNLNSGGTLIGAFQGPTHYFDGYISNLKIIKNALYTGTFTPPTSPSSGGSLLACASRYIEDRSSANHDIAANGDASVSGFNPFNEGYWSVNFDGTGDYLTVPDSSDLRMGTSDFTIEFWTYLNSKTGYTTFYDKGYTNSGGILLQSNNDLSDIRVFFGSGPDLTSSSQIPLKAWTHVALVRSSGTATLYFNGVSVGSFSSTDDLNNTSIVQIGRGSNQYELDGFISNLRITKGTGLYTSSFTPSTSPFTTTSQGATASEVKLLTCQSNRFVDNSSTGHSITASGNTSIDEKIPFTLLSRQTKLLNLQNNQDVNNRSFQDSSNLKNPVDIKSGLATPGRATQGTFSPFSGEIGKWGNYFDGSGDTLTSSSTDFALGTLDFTIELWFYKPGTPVTNQITVRYGGSYGPYFAYSGTLFYATTASGTWNLFNGTNLNLNDEEWNHIAFCRNGSTISIFSNGTRIATATSSSAIYQQNNTIILGDANTKGYISNFRTVIGSYIYDATQTTYTVPTKPFETPTVNGEQSVYFDGNGDYLIANADSKLEFDNNQFSVEWWENRPSTQSFDIALQLSEGGDNYSMLFGYNRQVLYASSAASSWDVLNNWNMYGSYTSKFGKNKWTHICVTRDSSGQIRAFIDGVMTNNTNIGASTNIYQEENAVCFGSGQGYSQNHSANIYISNARICIGSIPTDYQTSSTTNGTTIFTPSTDPFTTTSQGASNVKLLALRSKIFSDDSDNPTSMTAYNQTEIRYYNPFNDGYWSVGLDGGDNRITIADDNTLDLGSNDFTIEAWVYMTSYDSSGFNSFIHKGSLSTNSYHLDYKNGTTELRFLMYVSNVANTNLVGTTTLSLRTWYHIAVVRNGTSWTLYKDGTSVDTYTSSLTIDNTTDDLGIGRRPGHNDRRLNGYISNVRIVNGTSGAVYTSNFTPSTSPLTAVTDTALLTCQSNRFVDNSSNGHDVTTPVGTPEIDEFIPFQLLSRQTKLLTCQSNRFKDEANNKTITLAGNPKVFPYAPFVPSKSYDKDVMGGSVFIDNSGTSLVSFPVRLVENIGAQDFCFELWAYFNDVASAGPGFVGFGIPGNTGSTTVSLEIVSYNLKATYATGASYQVGQSSGTTKPFQWHHIVYCRENNTLAIFLNGERVASAATSATVGTGATVFKLGSQWYADARYVSGYYSNLRVTIGRSPFKSASSSIEVPTAPFPRTIDSDLLLNFTDGAVIDNSGKNNLETLDNTKVSSQTKKFGNGSMYFDGTGDYLYLPSNDNLVMGTGDFTFEMFFYYDAASYADGYLIDQRNTASQAAIAVYIQSSTGKFIYYVNGSARISDATPASVRTWQHFALVRYNGTTTIYVDGTASGSTYADSNNYVAPNTYIGARFNATSPFNGYMDDIRMTKGVARYTSNFTPPVRAFKNR